MNNNMDKEELCKILEGFHIQVVEIGKCADSVKAMKEIGVEKLKIAPRFFMAAKDAFVFRYSVELCKLLVDEKKNGDITVYRICDLIKSNSSYFIDESNVIKLCDELLAEIENQSETIENLRKRRNKTYGHNDKEYYNYSEKAVVDFPLDFEIIYHIVNLLNNFSFKILYDVGSYLQIRNLRYNSDDIKKLFGMSTWDEDIYKKFENSTSLRIKVR